MSAPSHRNDAPHNDVPHHQASPGAPMRRAILRGAVGLGLFAMLTAGIVAGTRALTAERIADNRLASQHGQLIEVLPEDLAGLEIERLLESAFILPASPALGQTAPFTAWRATREGNRDDTAAVVLPVIAPTGYSGDIDLLVGITDSGFISGVRVTRHQETPGLGDAIESRKSGWIEDFAGHSLSDPGPNGWAVTKDGGDFDAFTGATITPRAVVEAVHHTLGYVRDHHERLFGDMPDTPNPNAEQQGETP
ncbi:electron transport complex subunit RsxG [Halomonas sp. I5-271120]|uniref:electron transport complex subunit RsxG n=1 Tax=Halomonas sp. I5-271120 TaxID=3061632 RepID=UPI002714F18C|nr:electron transport complex subunit RsxG [Halomonas sp. I5-271120]